jgi:hypothetical protein
MINQRNYLDYSIGQQAASAVGLFIKIEGISFLFRTPDVGGFLYYAFPEWHCLN